MHISTLFVSTLDRFSLKISKMSVWFGAHLVWIVPTAIGLVFGNNNTKNVFYVFREIWFNIITKIISDIASYHSSMSVPATTKEVIAFDLNFRRKHGNI